MWQRYPSRPISVSNEASPGGNDQVSASRGLLIGPNVPRQGHRFEKAPSHCCLLAGNKRALRGHFATSILMTPLFLGGFLGFPFLIVCRSAGECKCVNI